MTHEKWLKSLEEGYKHNIGISFFYRETKESELKKEYIFIETNKYRGFDWNTAEVEMLKWLTKKNFYSGKIDSVISF